MPVTHIIDSMDDELKTQVSENEQTGNNSDDEESILGFPMDDFNSPNQYTRSEPSSCESYVLESFQIYSKDTDTAGDKALFKDTTGDKALFRDFNKQQEQRLHELLRSGHHFIEAHYILDDEIALGYYPDEEQATSDNTSVETSDNTEEVTLNQLSLKIPSELPTFEDQLTPEGKECFKKLQDDGLGVLGCMIRITDDARIESRKSPDGHNSLMKTPLPFDVETQPISSPRKPVTSPHLNYSLFEHRETIKGPAIPISQSYQETDDPNHTWRIVNSPY